MSIKNYLNENQLLAMEGRSQNKVEESSGFFPKSSTTVTFSIFTSHIKISGPAATKLMDDLNKKKLFII